MSNSKLIVARALAAVLAASTLGTVALAGGPAGTQPQKPAAPVKKKVIVPREDILLIMPNAGAEQDDVTEAIKKVNGEIIGEMGQGEMKILLVKAEHGKAELTERKLQADSKNFSTVDANSRVYADYVPSRPDPGFAASWHLFRMNVPKAWDAILTSARSGAGIAVFDSGTSMYGSDLGATGSHGADVTGPLKTAGAIAGLLSTGLFSVESIEGKLERAGNYIETLSYGFIDGHGHGTQVASTAAGSLENDKASVGINPRAYIFPIKVADGAMGQKIYTDDLALCAAMMVMYQKAATRIINISYSGMMDESRHRALHKLFKHWYDRKNGLIFVSAGNDGRHLSGKNHPYINVVSAVAQGTGMQLVKNSSWSSAYGSSVDFAAPGENIVCANPNGSQAVVDGTSFASPICAGVASLIWTANPNLRNCQVEDIMRRACKNKTRGWNERFGWGMPDANNAVALALVSR